MVSGRARYSLSGAVLIMVLTVVLCLPGLTLKGQKYPWREYTVSDGLPQTQANQLYEDSRGFIWILTRNGISRFDGLEFRNYFRKDGLPSNLVNWILEDHQGTVWALTLEGLSEYNGYGFRFFPYTERSSSENFAYACSLGDSIALILKDLASGRNRMISFRKGVYTDYSDKYDGFSHLNVVTFLPDRNSGDFVILDSLGHLWRYRNKEVTRLGDLTAVSLRQDRGKIIVQSSSESYEYSAGALIPLNIINSTGRAEMNARGNVTGLPLVYFDGREVTEIDHPLLSSYLIDSESNLWLGSEVNLHRLLSTAFSYLTEDDGLPKNTWAIARDRHGHIWFGSLTGELIEYDGKKLVPRIDHRKVFPGDLSFFKGSITSSDGTVYFSTKQGVLIWDGYSFSKLEGIPYDSQVCIIYEDPVDKSLLFGTGRGLYHLKNNKMSHYPDFVSTGHGVVEGIVREAENSYWLSAGKGVVLFEGGNAVRVRDTLVSSAITFTLVRDGRGGVWVTSEEGLFLKKGSSNSFTHGLPESINTSANSIIMMDSSRIMVGRMTDICIIDLKKFYRGEADYFRLYNATDGFTGNDCLDNGIIRGSDGRFWIMASGSVIILDDKKLRRNSHPPRITVTDVEFETDSLTWESLKIPELFYGRQGPVILTNLQNNLRFRYTGILTTNPEKVMYQHRLAGHEDVWSGYSSEGEAIYMNLKPGHYEFQLKAVNSDGVSTQRSYSLGFNIIPALWQRLGFKIGFAAIAGLILMFLSFLIARRSIRKKEQETQLRNELIRLQMNSILRQFDPHFTFNVISSVGSVIMKGSAESAYDYIVALSGLLRSSIADGSIMIRTLSDEIDFVRRYCELQKLRFRERFTYSVDIGEGTDLQRLLPKMTIQTFVENSVKHGIENRKEGGSIGVRVGRLNDAMLIIVSDNGVGREAAAASGKQGFGQGIRTIERIFEFMSRFNREKAGFEIHDLSDASGNAAGTEIRIIVPDSYRFDVPEGKEAKENERKTR
ncbi:MAG: histidine kinase [Bacteroidales bacterium]|nr:histidine kinase [Bacteroidales bacterium]